MTEPGRCHAGRCARMGSSGPGLCDPCRRLVGSHVAELPSLVAELADEPPEPPDVAHSPAHDWTRCRACLRRVGGLMAPGHADVLLSAGTVRTATGPRVSGSGETPLPGGADRLSWLSRAGDVRHARDGCPACRHHVECGHDPRCVCPDAALQTGAVPVAAALAGWVKLAAEELGFHAPAVGRVVAGRYGPVRRTSADDVRALCRVLARWHDRICGMPWAGEYAVEVHDLWDRAEAMSGRRAKLHRLGPCPTLDDDGRPCGAALYADPYATEVTCRACRSAWPRTRWLWLGALLRDEAV